MAFRISHEGDEKTVQVTSNSAILKEVAINKSDGRRKAPKSPSLKSGQASKRHRIDPNTPPVGYLMDQNPPPQSTRRSPSPSHRSAGGVGGEPSNFDLLINPAKKIKEEPNQASNSLFGGWFGGEPAPATSPDNRAPLSTRSLGSKKSLSSVSSSSISSDSESSIKTRGVRNAQNAAKSGGIGGDRNDDEEVEEAAMTYAQIQKKKAYYLSMFDKLENKGVKIHRKLSMTDDLKDIKSEYLRMKTQIDVENTIQFSRKMLMACVTGMEYLNKRYDPLRLKLNGWSETVFEEIETYDDIFERLYEKYGRPGLDQMEPEFQLLFAVGGSAMWFHLSHTIFAKEENVDLMMDKIKQDPVFMQHVVNELAKKNALNGLGAHPPQYYPPAPIPTRPQPPPAQQVSQMPQARPLDPRPMPSGPANILPVQSPSANVDDVLKRIGSRQPGGHESSSESEGSLDSDSDSRAGVTRPAPGFPGSNTKKVRAPVGRGRGSRGGRGGKSRQI